MKRFVLTRSAERDLDQIKSFLVEKAGATIARKVLKDIRGALDLLGAEPGAGHVRDDLTTKPVKFWPTYSPCAPVSGTEQTFFIHKILLL